MKPLDRKPVRFPTKTDFHPPRGLENFWEHMRASSNKRSRAEAKKEILIELYGDV